MGRNVKYTEAELKTIDRWIKAHPMATVTETQLELLYAMAHAASDIVRSKTAIQKMVSVRRIQMGTNLKKHCMGIRKNSPFEKFKSNRLDTSGERTPQIKVTISVDDSKLPLRKCGRYCPFNDNFEYCQLYKTLMDKDDKELGGRVRLCVHSQIE